MGSIVNENGRCGVAGSRSVADVLIFGEVLYDCFEGGQRVLGGAPFNVAWGLKGLGLDPLLVSAVGADADGRGVRERMTAWGLRTDGLLTVAGQATGAVHVTVADDEPRYEICHPRAWDFIEDTGAQARQLLYHGLLALRSATSRATLEAIRARSAAPRFFDINLRPPYDDPELLRQWLPGTDWLKLNLDELARVARGPALSLAASPPHLERLRTQYGIRNILLTAGAEGLRLHGEYGEAVCAPAPPVQRLADTVGAGDAISAVALAGIQRGLSAQTIVNQAGRFASRICEQQGATVPDKEFYTHE